MGTPKTKMFDGKRYKLHGCWHDREVMENIAARYRREGYLARVVEISKWIPTYCLYKRKK